VRARTCDDVVCSILSLRCSTSGGGILVAAICIYIYIYIYRYIYIHIEDTSGGEDTELLVGNYSWGRGY